MRTENSLVSLRLSELKVSGATPVEAIKAIHAEFGLSLVEAKQAFSLSPSWVHEATNGDRLHEQVLAALAREPRS